MGGRYNALPFSPGRDLTLMERLIEYVTHHPLLAGAVVLALVVVVTFESRAARHRPVRRSRRRTPSAS